MRRLPSCAAALSLALLLPVTALAEAQPAAPSAFERDKAIAYSQAAVGRAIGDAAFVNQDREPVRLAEFRGKPLVINLVFTACAQSCPLVVQSLARAVWVAQEALGPQSFSVVTIGFDSANDTPSRMRAYAASRGIDAPNWQFLSGDEASLERLMTRLGFLYFPSPRGFDHLAQVSVLDAEGRVYQQIYGDDFDPPALVEPLKSLALGGFGRITSLGQAIERIRLFCTFYDPARDRYSLDYSIVIMIAVGGITLTGLAVIVVRAWLGQRRPARRA